MPSHPNRGPKGHASNPTPEDIASRRQDAQLSTKEAAALIYRTERNWQQWEAGDRRMDPALWELWRMKANV